MKDCLLPLRNSIDMEAEVFSHEEFAWRPGCQIHVLGKMVQKANANKGIKIDLEEFCNFMQKIWDSSRI